jgi:HSP20 family protein
VVYKPKYQSRYSENAWEVTVSLPGVVKDHLDVTAENEILEIRATRLLDVPEGWRPLADYPAEKNYRLRLDVGPEVDPSGISARLEDGVLTLELPLREEVKPRKIEVK